MLAASECGYSCKRAKKYVATKGKIRVYVGVGGWRGLTFTVTNPSRWSGVVEANAHDVVCSRLEIHLLKFIFWLTNQKNDVLSFVVSSDSNDCSQ